MTGRSKVVVALDGSDGALHALEWACRYAEMAGADVDAVHVWGHPERGYGASVSETYEAMQAGAFDTVHDQVARYTDQHHPTVGINTRLVEGVVVDALVDESHHTELLVVGCRGQRRGTVDLLGSVSRGVADRAACPVVVVHPRDRVARS